MYSYGIFSQALLDALCVMLKLDCDPVMHAVIHSIEGPMWFQNHIDDKVIKRY